MIGPNATAASIAHSDSVRISARHDEYLARYEADDLSDAETFVRSRQATS